MNSAEIREKFLKFFENYHHQRVPSSSLIPAADPTLLFTNAGMVQFKDVFLGLSDQGYQRATTVQKCVRAGGKHNDLENVGFTARHHTFFEMLGNFSFGDYFKKDAIAFAWELLTRHYSLPVDKLWVTVYEKDDEAFALWEKQGVPKNRIGRLGEKDNFWAMGDTGPCGPCTEIYYDWGVKNGCGKPTCAPGCSCDTRFLEIWNLVFMQFNRDSSGKLTPLPKPSVDTGAGLERLSSVLQNVYSNYDSDLFQPILQAIGKRVGKKYGENADDDVAFRVVADHLRASTFLSSDGVIPSNEGRGYVLRRIIRRAIRYGKKLGQEKPFIYELVGAVVKSLGSVYPELNTNQKIVEVLIKEEEEKFHETLHRGMGLLDESIQKTLKEKKKKLSGDVAFKLYDTFGFPLDLIEVICREHKLEVDTAAFDKGMEQQRAQSQGTKGGVDVVFEKLQKAFDKLKISDTKFQGYETTEAKGKVTALFTKEGDSVSALGAGSGFAVFDQTPFYAESGGQVGDTGHFGDAKNKAAVEDTFKLAKRFVHKIHVKTGTIETAKSYTLSVNPATRKNTMIHHTATHMLHAALRKTLGERVKQAGSLVDAEHLRFDFTYPRALSDEEILKIEAMVNSEIGKGTTVTHTEMPYDKAIQSGALAFFDEKYGKNVRVIRVGGDDAFSVELCGGTHLSTISDIGIVKITAESSVASGVRRLEAVAGPQALKLLSQRSEQFATLESKLGVCGDQALQKVDSLLQQNKTMRAEIDGLKLKVAGGSTRDSKAASGEKFGDVLAFIEEVPVADAKVLRSLVDQIRDKNKTKTVVLLGARDGSKVSLCVGVTKDLAEKLDASKIVKLLSEEVGGTGGGRPDFAQAGGTKPEGIPKAFDKLRSWLRENV